MSRYSWVAFGLSGADLGHADLHLERLELVGEDRPEGLRVDVGERARRDVARVVGVAPQVDVADAAAAQALELAVAAGRREPDAVVDLRRPCAAWWTGSRRRTARHRSISARRRCGPERCPCARTPSGRASTARARRTAAWSRRWLLRVLSSCREPSASRLAGPVGHDGLGHRGDRLLGQVHGALGAGDRDDARVDACGRGRGRRWPSRRPPRRRAPRPRAGWRSPRRCPGRGAS